MGKHAVKILKVDTEELIKMLNGALAEEWLAYYQYWIGARVIEGPMRSEVEPELLVHADEELDHAVKVVERIIQLGGTPLLNPAQWVKHSECDYLEPKDPYVEVILNQNLEGERCAIKRYEQIAEFTHGKDHSTHQMAINILNDELEHEEDIEAWLEDLEIMKKNFKNL